MPLTPAEVHNVVFKKPPIGKRGYDEEEVDAFLDIIEVELSRLIEENNELRARGAGGAPLAASAAAGGGPPNAALTAELSAAKDHNNRLQTHIAELEKALTQGGGGAEQQVVQLQHDLEQHAQALIEARGQLDQARQAAAAAQAAVVEAQQQAQVAQQQAQAARQQAQAVPAPVLSPADQHQQAIQVLALAQATADQHLATSKAEADRLVSDAQAKAAAELAEAQSKSQAQVSEAEARAHQLDEESTARAAAVVRDAEKRVQAVTGTLEQRKVELEHKVEELRTFEREYRARLKTYIESQLRDLAANGRAEPESSDGQDSGSFAEAQQG